MSSLTGSLCIAAFYSVFTFCLSFGSVCSNGAACGFSVSPEQCTFSDPLVWLLSLAALDLGPSFYTVPEITACTVNFSQRRGLLGLFQREELCAFQLLHPWDLSAHGLVLPCMPFLADCISKSLPCK